MIRVSWPRSLESKSQRFGKRFQLNMAYFVAFFYRFQLIVKIDKIGLKFDKALFRDNIPEKMINQITSPKLS
jgi:hypothetical protein